MEKINEALTRRHCLQVKFSINIISKTLAVFFGHIHRIPNSLCGYHFCSGIGFKRILPAKIYPHSLQHQYNSEYIRYISIKGRAEEMFFLLYIFPDNPDINSCAFDECFKILLSTKEYFLFMQKPLRIKSGEAITEMKKVTFWEDRWGLPSMQNTVSYH